MEREMKAKSGSVVVVNVAILLFDLVNDLILGRADVAVPPVVDVAVAVNVAVSLLLLLPVQTDAQQGAQPLLRVKVGQPDIRIHMQHISR